MIKAGFRVECGGSNSMHTRTCRICGAVLGGSPITAKEMMLGRRDSFDYFECPSCGCVQIAEYPPNIADYYPSDYYSMVSGPGARSFQNARRWLHKRRAAYALGTLDPVGFLLGAAFGTLECYGWLRTAGVGFDSAILDVGCGNGFLLSILHRDGFTRLEGVDPFAADESRQKPGFVIKKTLAEAAPRPDFILLSHSLEHMPDQKGMLAELRAMCGSATWLCVRLPLATEAWRRYREHWVQLDPPRHYYVHTARSFDELARQSGFRIERTVYDSTALQFWGSEQNRLGIPLSDPRSVGTGKESALFDRRRVRDWGREARELNQRQAGDQATFFLRPG